MATRFLGSDFQINVDGGGGNGILGNQVFPNITTLTDGRFAVAYESDTSGPDAIVAIFNADGSMSSPSYLNVFPQPANQLGPEVAARPGGGFGVAFTNQAHADGTPDPDPLNITYVAVSANGVLGPPVAIADFNVGSGHDNLFDPKIATLSTGRQVVVFENAFTPNVDDDIYLNVVSADGTTTQFAASSPLAIAANGSMQARPAVAAAGNTALVVFQDSTAGTTDIVAGIFDGATNTYGGQITIADHAARLGFARVAALDDHRYVIVYDDLSNVFGRIYDVSSHTLSSEFMIDQPGSFGTANAFAEVAATADGGFVVSWTFDNTIVNDFDVLGRRFNSDGVAMGNQLRLNRLIDGIQSDPTVAVSGANAFFAWNDFGSRPGDTSPPSVRGRMMTLTTPPDFNDNGISDILWRNSNGALAAWDINKTGAINSGSSLTYGGVAVNPDASWSIAGISDFNGDGRADLLWRNTSGATALWTLNGSVITSSSPLTAGGVAVNPDPSWSVAGVGDFNFDGNSDILWRNAGGALALWTMNGSAIVSSSLLTSDGTTVIPDASWSVAGIGDLDGDGESDIIWRNTSGEVACWLMDGSSIDSSGDLTASGFAVKPDASWSIAAIGDFNADGTADILWRNTDGSLAGWLMNGTTIESGTPVTFGGIAVAPDASWHIIETGDFNGDARTDILWRNDSGALAEWLMNGNTVIASVTPSAGGIPVSPDATWLNQAKPTDFG